MRKSIILSAVALLAAGRLSGTGQVLAAAPPTLPSAHVWVTTPDGTMRMADLGATPFRPGASTNLTVTVDPSRVYQRMDGFGASITDSSASVLYRLGPQQRDAAMRDLFSADKLDVLRQPMGASDFVDGPFYTYDDLPSGANDYEMHHFSVQHDRKQILPLLRRALALNPR